jgi:hypothetical protein
LNQYKDENATFFSDPYCSYQETKLGKHNQKFLSLHFFYQATTEKDLKVKYDESDIFSRSDCDTSHCLE